jgi:adenylate cyclase
MTTGEEPGRWPELHREHRALVVVDVVESVRLMQQHEDEFIGQWRRFVAQVRDQLLPAFRGRLVKSLGDGMLLEFERVHEAAQAALALRGLAASRSTAGNPGLISLRMGVHCADVVIDELDLYGAGVSLAARLTALAGPGQIVISQAAADELVESLDGEMLDLGECFLKHLSEPVRAFRLETPPTALVRAPGPSAVPLLGVLPLTAAPGLATVAAALSDDLASAVGRITLWHTTSRLTTHALQGRDAPAAAIGQRLGADFLLQGRLTAGPHGTSLRLTLEESRHADLVWESQVDLDPADLQDWHERQLPALIAGLANAVLSRPATAGHGLALPNVPGYALMLQAVRQLHRLGRTDFELAGAALEHLSERYPRSSDVHAWMAKWHFLSVAQSMAGDRRRAMAAVRQHLNQSLAENEQHGLALAVNGHLAAFEENDLQQAERLLRAATRQAPNESLGWLFLADALTHQDRGSEAVEAIEIAHRLSPLDPLRYYFDHFAARAYRVQGNLERAVHFAERSLRANALHLPSLVDLIVLQSLRGNQDEAQQTAQRYLALRPGASVQRFIDHHPAGPSPRVKMEAAALLEAGIPR